MKMVTRYIPIVIMVLLVAALSTSTVLAAPGGNGKGKGNKGGNDSGGVTLSVSGSLGESNPYQAWGEEVYTVSGSGLGPNEAVHISLASPGCCSGFTVWTDRTGEFSFSNATGAPGTYSVSVLQSNGNRVKKIGGISFLVVE